MGNSTNWTLGNIETGKSVGDNSGNVFKVYVAKVMPLIKFGTAEESKVALKKSCFINSPKCKVTVANQVKIRNFINLHRSNNSSITSAKHGEKLEISIMNGDPDTMTVTSETNKKIN